MLLGNYSVLHKSPTKFMSGVIASGDRANWNKSGLQRNMGAGTNTNFKLASIPMGFGAGGAWLLPKTAGGMASRGLVKLSLTPTATIYGGVTTSASAEIALSAEATGSLITSGAGSANLSITTNNPLLTASINGEGVASFSITTNAPILGAIAGMGGNTTLSITPNATLTAIGHMEGTTIDESAMTPDTVSSAVWNAVLSDFQAAGTTGEALGAAGSGGVNYTALAQAVWEYVTRTVTSGSAPTAAENATAVWGKTIEGLNAEEVLRIVAAVLAGKVSGAGTGVEIFKGLDGVTNRVISTVDAAGNRTVVTLDGT